MTSPLPRDDPGSAPSMPPGNARGAELGRSGMLLFVINEATLFACLVSSYFYLATASANWPGAGIGPPELVLPLIMTAALLSSSAVLIYAERALDRGNVSHYRAGVVATVVLGAVFLILQTKEYASMLRDVSPTETAYGSLFYTITGLHGAHVAFGLLVLVWSLFVGHGAARTGGRSLTVRNASLYWHFVDGVWIVILTSLYLSPRWA